MKKTFYLILIAVLATCANVKVFGQETNSIKKYDYQAKYSEGMAMVFASGKSGVKYGFIDESGKEVIPLIYAGGADFHEGLARVKLNGKFGFIDKTGKVVIPMKYDDARNFKDGKVTVVADGHILYIDKTGKAVTN